MLRGERVDVVVYHKDDIEALCQYKNVVSTFSIEKGKKNVLWLCSNNIWKSKGFSLQIYRLFCELKTHSLCYITFTSAIYHGINVKL
jgi:hypothetical protein